MPILRLLLCAGPLVILAGCGENISGRLAINGAVSYAGEPIKKGSITFRPTDPKLPDVSAPIADGTYQLAAHLGPKAEEYTVKIVAFQMKKPAQTFVPSYLKDDAASNPEAAMVPEQYVPKKYNEDSQLKVKFDAAKPRYDFKLDK